MKELCNQAMDIGVTITASKMSVSPWRAEETKGRVLQSVREGDQGIIDNVLAKGSGALVDRWLDKVVWKKEKAGNLMARRHGVKDLEPINLSQVPHEVVTCLDAWLAPFERLNHEFGKVDWFVVRRAPWAAKAKAKNDRHKRNENVTDKMIRDIEEACSMKSGLVASTIWKGGRDEWEKDGENIMARVNQGLGRLKVLGFDSEGNGDYYQLGWVCEKGLEALVLGPQFFPQELLDVMARDDVYLLGIGIWGDLQTLTGRKIGWRAVDMAVMSSDLPACNHSKPGMAREELQAPLKHFFFRAVVMLSPHFAYSVFATRPAGLGPHMIAGAAWETPFFAWPRYSVATSPFRLFAIQPELQAPL